MSLRKSYDVAVIGAGPAGLAAATVTARAGLSTVVLDEQMSPGGQIYRAITTTPLRRREILGDAYWDGAALVDAFQASGAQHVGGATVWSLTGARELGVSVGGAARLVTARRVVIATGALERPFPVPGWTLPGVMTAGAAQILLKASGLAPAGTTVLAGCGPLLWLLAWQYLNAGAPPALILDTTPRENVARAAWQLPGFLRSPYFRKGLALMAAVRRRVPVVSGVTALAAEGDGRVETVVWRSGAGAERRRAVGTLLLHQGVVPNTNLAMAAGAVHRWDDDQLCWLPQLDGLLNSSLDGIAIAGDGAGIAGAEAAAARGELAGIAAARALGAAAPDPGPALRTRARYTRGRRFLDALYRPAAAFRLPRGDTIVCRCEEVTARQIAETVALGCPGPNQMKAFLRCGMGPCQGRLCGLTVTELIAAARGVSPAEVGHYRIRPPVKPVTLGEIASLPKTEAAVNAVVRG